MKLENIVREQIVKSLDYLKEDRELCEEIQTRLCVLGLLPDKGIDGLYGPQTKEAFEQFKQITYEANPDTLGAGSAKKLLETKELHDHNLVSKSQAEQIYGNSISNEQLRDLNLCLNRFKISTYNRICHFISQTAEESGGLRYMSELADGRDYEGSRKLGNTHLGDGPKYKGAGVIQVTGRNNYQALANYLKDPRVMEGVKYVSKKYPFTSAGFWWHQNEMNSLCDRNASVKEITRRVNGGLNGLPQRQAYYNKAKKVFSDRSL